MCLSVCDCHLLLCNLFTTPCFPLVAAKLFCSHYFVVVCVNQHPFFVGLLVHLIFYLLVCQIMALMLFLSARGGDCGNGASNPIAINCRKNAENCQKTVENYRQLVEKLWVNCDGASKPT